MAGDTNTPDSSGIPSAREGMLDLQLTLPSTLLPAVQPIMTVYKRDGRETPFDSLKIAKSIFVAAQSVGGDDRELARHLASSIALYLSKHATAGCVRVDEVRDAAERVLAEMGHERTAIAYARHYEQRARLSRLESGDGPNRREPDRSLSLFGPTTGDTTASWTPDELSKVLRAELQLDPETSDAIASDVDAQLDALNLDAATISLVRELVRMQLSRRGHADALARTKSLELPFRDVEREIEGLTAPHGQAGPEDSDRRIARRVKQAYAASGVFSPAVAEAHRRGAIHIHGLGEVDRLESASLSLDRVKRYGAVGAESLREAALPRQPETLIAQLAGSHASLGTIFRRGLRWDSVNYYLAPFFDGLRQNEIDDLAKVLLYEFAYRALTRRPGPDATLQLDWSPPDELFSVPALGPGGRETGRSYETYAPVAKEFAAAFLRHYVALAGHQNGVPLPALSISVPPAIFRQEGHETYLSAAIEAAALTGRVRFVESSESPFLPLGAPAGDASNALGQRVTLNLPRLGLQTGGPEEVFTVLERGVEMAAKALAEKRAFLERLFTLGSEGPLGLVTHRREGRPFVPFDSIGFAIGVTGVDSCVRGATGQSLHESEAALQLGRELLRQGKASCQSWSDALGMKIAFVATEDESTSARFARKDLERYGESARAQIDADSRPGPARYGAGVRLSEAIELEDDRRIEREGSMHSDLASGATIWLSGDFSNPSDKLPALRDAFLLHRCHAVSFSAPSP